jgi:hypothetical protein
MMNLGQTILGGMTSKTSAGNRELKGFAAIPSAVIAGVQGSTRVAVLVILPFLHVMIQMIMIQMRTNT